MSLRAGLDSATVVAVAANLIDRQGIDALTLALLAEQLGVRTPSLYNHVSGLPALHSELALLGLRELGACITQAAIGKSTDAAIISIATAYREFAHRRPGLYAAALLWTDLNDSAAQVSGGQIVDVVLAVLTGYGVHGERAIHTVRGLRSLMHGFVSLEAAHGFGLPLDLDESFHQLLQIYIAGLRSVVLPSPD